MKLLINSQPRAALPSEFFDEFEDDQDENQSVFCPDIKVKKESSPWYQKSLRIFFQVQNVPPGKVKLSNFEILGLNHTATMSQDNSEGIDEQGRWRKRLRNVQQLDADAKATSG
jgi:hypothetical protein